MPVEVMGVPARKVVLPEHRQELTEALVAVSRGATRMPARYCGTACA